jgi:HAE1 family hydrophobic/amphiphilic exporter-1
MIFNVPLIVRPPTAQQVCNRSNLFPEMGMAAFPLLPVAPLPQVDFPTISVSATLPGASPETMASAVAQPLETGCN